MQPQEIQLAMQHVRANLGTDVHQLVRRARDTTDWRYYVRRHPWICLGGVAAAGYLLGPPRGLLGDRQASLSKPSRDAISARPNAAASLASAVSSVLIRTLASAVVHSGLDLLRGRERLDLEANARPPRQAGSPADQSHASSRTDVGEPW